jgi:hypothetical protein
MNYFDPARPKMANQLPLLIGAPMQCAVPELALEPCSCGEPAQPHWTCRVMLCRGQNSFSWSHRQWHGSSHDVPGLLQAYLDDPEGCLVAQFGWEQRMQHRQQQQHGKEVLSLEDLGI